MSMDFSSEEKMVIRRALSGYIQWCQDRAFECAQKTSRAPPEAVGQALAEKDRAHALYRRFKATKLQADYDALAAENARLNRNIARFRKLVEEKGYAMVEETVIYQADTGEKHG